MARFSESPRVAPDITSGQKKDVEIKREKPTKRILFIINTPSQVHTWHYIINGLKADNQVIKILARDYGPTAELLKRFGFEFETFKPVGNRSMRLLGALEHFQNCRRLVGNFSPSIIIGFGLDAAVTAARLRKPCIVFIDDEHTYIQNKITSILASATITPDTFSKVLSQKHIRLNSLKELAYLHPDYFTPDENIFTDLKLKKGEKYILIRFNLLDAVHDIGKHAFPVSEQYKLVKELEKYARVFISPESPLSTDLECYRLSVPTDKIHHVLYYAQLIVSDSCTMTTEAAVMGTPAVRFHPLVGRENDPGVFRELEQKYNLVYSFQDPSQAVRKAIDLIKTPDLKTEWARKQQILFSDKRSLSKFMIDFIENFPASFQ